VDVDNENHHDDDNCIDTYHDNLLILSNAYHTALTYAPQTPDLRMYACTPKRLALVLEHITKHLSLWYNYSIAYHIVRHD